MSSNSPQRRAKAEKLIQLVPFLLLTLCFLIIIVDMVNRSLTARQAHLAAEQATVYLNNDGLEQFVIDYFTRYDAEEMIPIIKCESHFRHFSEDGTVLKNYQGSSATGIAQILSSMHPDQHVISRYNRRNLTNFSKEDFDITTLTGNLQYALVLYRTRGVGDWECATKL